MSETKPVITVEVAYALPNEHFLKSLDVEQGTTMFEAALHSGITAKYPDLDLENAEMGIYGKVERKPKERVLQQGDRVEIYRPLIADPKEVRKQRAAEAKKKREAGA